MKGKVALITGASSGIGAVVAEELAKKGMKVVATARRKDKLVALVEKIKSAGGDAVAFQCDVSNGVSVAWAFSFADETYGGVDFVFANAGIEGGLMQKPLADQDSQRDIRSVFDINVVGVLETLRHSVTAFEKRGGGTIVFSSSVAAWCGNACHEAMTKGGAPKGHGMAYMASKASVDMIADMAHGTYMDQGVKVYNFNIAQFASEMGSRCGFEENATSAPFNPIRKESIGNPVHIAEAIIAILDGTSKWPAGTAIAIDNDITVHAKHFFDKRKDPAALEHWGWRSPEELKKVAMDVKGQPYRFKEEL